MLTLLAFIFLVGLSMAAICQRLRLPRIIGMLVTGIAAVLMILTALVFRSAGVAICLARTSLTRRERLFCMIAYLPKATVQAAIGSVPLAMGLPCGQIVLSVAVLAILITAPLGALGMDLTYKHLLKKEKRHEDI